jgi:kynureninase
VQTAQVRRDSGLELDAARERARRLDGQDDLAAYSDRFIPLPKGLVYLDGNSLGRPPRHLPELLAQAVRDQWGQGLIGSWDRWQRLPYEVGDQLGTSLLGAKKSEVSVSDSTTVNLYKLVLAAVAARPDRTVMLIESDAFPTDRYVLDGIARHHGLQVREVASDVDGGFGVEDVEAVLETDVAVACLSHVGYRSAALADMAAVTAAIHSAGALVLWDLCHSAGAVPIDLTGAAVDLAVGCTYKYLNAGPGAPAFLFVRKDLQNQLDSPIWGWFGSADQFEMPPGYAPRRGLGRFQAGTPPVLGLLAVREGSAVVAEAGVDRLRAKGSDLTNYALQLADAWLVPLGFRVASPRSSERRGSHLTLEHRDARRLCARLVELGVITDFRTPDRIRLGMAALTTSFSDVCRALHALSTAAQ